MANFAIIRKTSNFIPFIFILFLQSNPCLSNKIVVVNSDITVERYEKTSSSFKKALHDTSASIIEFNLNGRTDAEDDFKQLIDIENPDFIYCVGSNAYNLAKSHSRNRKLVFSSAINWRKFEISDDVYGVTSEMSPAQQLTFLRYFFPKIKTIGLLYSDKFNREYVETIKKDASAFGINIINRSVADQNNIMSELPQAMLNIDMFWIISDPVVFNNDAIVDHIFQYAQKQNIPVYAYSDVFISKGAVLSISTNSVEIGRQSANLIKMIEKDKVPGGTIQSPIGSIITLNKCALDNLHLDINSLDSITTIIGCNKK